MLFASHATTQMRPLRRNPDGTGLAGRSAVSRRSPRGPTIGFASLRASHPGKPPSRPRGTYSEVPYAMNRRATIVEDHAAAAATSDADDPLWYKDAIVYELHVKAFFDSNDDGIGDVAGLT